MILARIHKTKFWIATETPIPVLVDLVRVDRFGTSYKVVEDLSFLEEIPFVPAERNTQPIKRQLLVILCWQMFALRKIRI